VTYSGLLFVVVFASWMLVNGGVSLVVYAWWRRAAERIAARPAARRKRILFTVRIAPAISATVVACAIVWRAFHRFEPRNAVEAPGWILWAAALVALAVVLGSLLAAIRALVEIRGFRRACEQTAVPFDIGQAAVPMSSVEDAFPIVAVVGIWRPHLFIARRVVEECDPGELASIAAHEESHVRRLDNVGRLIVECCPDFVGLLPGGRSLNTAWLIAAEDTADDDAASRFPGGRLDLASALVRVAQLAVKAPPHLLASSLFSAGCVERRVRRLLDEPAPLQPPGGGWRWVGLFLPAMVVVSTEGVLRAVHQGIEVAIALLP
jgi:beta-lactamase regulating signal transducer with metallopeptidase domain